MIITKKADGEYVEGQAKCFAVATPKPLQENEILNIKCHLCGDRKIPVYAGAAARKIR